MIIHIAAGDCHTDFEDAQETAAVGDMVAARTLRAVDRTAAVGVEAFRIAAAVVGILDVVG